MTLHSNKLLLGGAIVGVLLMGILGCWLGGLLLTPPSEPAPPEVAETAPAPVERKADLQADWADAENPHEAASGAWAFTQNHKPLTWVDNWEGLPAEQIRGWYPGVSTAEDYLFVCRAMAPSSPQALGIVEVGDILMHTATAGREPGLISWTSAWTGNAAVHLKLWPTRTLNRTNSWRLRLLSRATAKPLESGEIPEDGTITREKPAEFNATALRIQSGDVLELELKPGLGMAYGDFIAISLSVTPGVSATTSAVPAPNARPPAAAAPAGAAATISLLSAAVVALSLLCLGLLVVIIMLLKRQRN